MAFVVAVDIGGTFTDLVAYDRESGDVRYAKCPTTYGDFVDGIMECLRKAGIEPRGASLVNHGTTLVINALIERRGAKAALIATKGFGDVLEIARGNRPDPFDLYYRRDEPLIPRELRYEVGERIGADGSVIEPLDEAALAALGSTLVGDGIEAVAVSFMNAYANPQHEERAVEILRRAVPDAYVTHGTDICREWYEYERTATVAANAYRRARKCRAISRRSTGDCAGRAFDGTALHDGLERRRAVGRARAAASRSRSSNRGRSAAASERRLTPRPWASPTSSRSTWAARRPNARWSRTGGFRSIRCTMPEAMCAASRSSRR